MHSSNGNLRKSKLFKVFKQRLTAHNASAVNIYHLTGYSALTQ